MPKCFKYNYYLSTFETSSKSYFSNQILVKLFTSIFTQKLNNICFKPNNNMQLRSSYCDTDIRRRGFVSDPNEAPCTVPPWYPRQLGTVSRLGGRKYAIYPSCGGTV